MIRFSSLASSSTYGNSYLIEAGDGTRVLVDAGARARQLVSGLASLGVDPTSLSAVLLTHEHADHVYCLGLRRPRLALGNARLLAHPAVMEACPATANYLRCGGPEHGCAGDLVPGRELSIGGLSIEPFLTPHDAVAPLGFVFRAGNTSLGLATDLGHLPGGVLSRLAGCTHLIIESNHDRELELNSGRPSYLIDRVLGPIGHLSNDQAAAGLRELVEGTTRSVLLAHLSLDCNDPGLAVETAARGLKAGSTRWPGLLLAAPAAGPSGWIT